MTIKILIINVRNGCFVNSPFPVPKYAFLILILSDMMVNQIIFAYLRSIIFIPEHIFDNKGLIESVKTISYDISIKIIIWKNGIKIQTGKKAKNSNDLLRE